MQKSSVVPGCLKSGGKTPVMPKLQIYKVTHIGLVPIFRRPSNSPVPTFRITLVLPKVSSLTFKIEKWETDVVLKMTWHFGRLNPREMTNQSLGQQTICFKM